jgi:hypothetical protein
MSGKGGIFCVLAASARPPRGIGESLQKDEKGEYPKLPSLVFDGDLI